MPKVLVIDDDSVCRIALCSLLSKHGLSVISATDGRDGERMFKSENPDLIVVDIFMPEMDGFEIITALRNSNPDVPIVAISDVNKALGHNSLTIAATLGASLTIAKPISMAKVNQIYNIIADTQCSH